MPSTRPADRTEDRDRSSPWWAISLRGVAMGAADVVPGVSGGTMALVLGIYPRFIAALSSLNLGLLRRLFAALRAGTSALWSEIRSADLHFLAFLGAGIVSAVVTLAKIIPSLIETYPATMNGLFFGMIVASTAVPYRMLDRRGPVEAVTFVAAALFSFWVVGLGLFPIDAGLPFLFLSGAVAICAMMLPGISGSFLLLILGQYTRVLEAIHSRDLAVIAVFGAGCAVGLLSFSRVLQWLLTHYRNATLAALCGLMVGSLRKIWPFEVPLEVPVTVGDKVVQDAVKTWPLDPGYPGPIVAPLIAMAVGFAIVAALERLGRQPKG